MPLSVATAVHRPRRLRVKLEGLPWQEAAALLGLCAWLSVVAGGMAEAGSIASPACCQPGSAGPGPCDDALLTSPP